MFSRNSKLERQQLCGCHVIDASVNFISVERYWFLTWTTYGTWLPGDHRGFVGQALDESGAFVNYNQIGMLPAPPDPQWNRTAEQNLQSPAVVLNHEQAEAVFDQRQETASIRSWLLIAVGIMRTHLHLVVGVPSDPDPEKLLGDFKAYGTRRLNRERGQPLGNSWWTKGGSKRKLLGEQALTNAVEYVRQQANPMLIWTREAGRLL